MSAVEFEGQTREDILTQAKKVLGVRLNEDLIVEILNESEKRNLLFQKRTVIRARVSVKSVLDRIQDFLTEVVQKSKIGDLVEVGEDDDGGIHAEVVGFDTRDLKEGREILDAIQFIGSRYLIHISNHDQELPRISVDAQNLRERRELQLDSYIRHVHRKAIGGETYTTMPMFPNERKRIHLGLEGLGGVRTMSLGSGLKKRVQVSPVNERTEDDSVSV